MKAFGFAGYSGSGKTTLIERLIPLFIAQGLRISLIKHSHHHFDIDKPQKDSWRFREAGATQVLLTSDQRWALMSELRGSQEPTLAEHLQTLAPCDLVLVEGFKCAELPKIEVYRPSLKHPALWENTPHIVAVASDEKIQTHLPCLDLNNVDEIAQFILDAVKINAIREKNTKSAE